MVSCQTHTRTHAHTTCCSKLYAFSHPCSGTDEAPRAVRGSEPLSGGKGRYWIWTPCVGLVKTVYVHYMWPHISRSTGQLTTRVHFQFVVLVSPLVCHMGNSVWWTVLCLVFLNCVCVSLCVFQCVFQCVCFSVYVSVCVFQCVCFSVCISVCVIQCVSVCVSVCVFQCVWKVFACACVSMCVCYPRACPCLPFNTLKAY